MLRTFLADLHVHTCLSPCGEDEMTPTAIVRQARKMGLDVIAVCDHNSTRNVDPVRRAGRGEGLVVIGGVEVSSEEEVHVLGLFRDDEGLREMQRVIDENLLAENTPGLFGQQWLCDERDAIVGRESRLLIGATGLTIEEVVERIHSLGGLAVPSHVDRERFSILSVSPPPTAGSIVNIITGSRITPSVLSSVRTLWLIVNVGNPFVFVTISLSPSTVTV